MRVPEPEVRPNPELSEIFSYPQERYSLPVGVLAPRSQVKVQRFTRSFNFSNSAEWEEPAWPQVRWGRLRPQVSPLVHLRAMDDAVPDVRTQEEVVDWRQVREWVRSGRMQLTDLVDVGRGWETVQACAELGEEVDLAVSRSRWGHRLRVAGAVALFFLLPVALLSAAALLWRVLHGF
ncbi:MAG: hypothetical protein M3Y59_19960 [Myxococcota bacterium]|nr:hypothetical protein [Myxococcota bacterium]